MNWKTAYLETRVLSADPVELIDILYEYAMLSVQDARDGLARGDIIARSRAISKVIAILGELEGSLNLELGGEIASNLSRLYHYMRKRLTGANLSQTDEPLAEVEALLKTLGEAWHVIGREKEPAKDDSGLARGFLPTMESMADYSAHSWSA
jgi:flagellar protein FliS